MAVEGSIDVDYLKRRHRVHQLRESGYGPTEIAEITGFEQRVVYRYLSAVKPLLPRPRADYSWQERAACQSADIDLFYPPPQGIKSRSKKFRAGVLCAGCPVRQQCLDTALSHFEQFGVWGGVDFTKVRYTFDERSGEVGFEVGEYGAVAQVG